MNVTNCSPCYNTAGFASVVTPGKRLTGAELADSHVYLEQVPLQIIAARSHHRSYDVNLADDQMRTELAYVRLIERTNSASLTEVKQGALCPLKAGFLPGVPITTMSHRPLGPTLPANWRDLPQPTPASSTFSLATSQCQTDLSNENNPRTVATDRRTWGLAHVDQPSPSMVPATSVAHRKGHYAPEFGDVIIGATSELLAGICDDRAIDAVYGSTVTLGAGRLLISRPGMRARSAPSKPGPRYRWFEVRCGLSAGVQPTLMRRRRRSCHVRRDRASARFCGGRTILPVITTTRGVA